MEYLPDVASQPQQKTVGLIACCMCSKPIEPNAANMCSDCLRQQVDITENIPKQGTLYFCQKCEKYLVPPASWVLVGRESKELLALCVKKIRGMSEVHLVDANFVWTEEHSKRIKVKMVVQAEVMNGAIVQQTFIVEFTVCNQMCDECHRIEAKDTWKACVQIRQKVTLQLTFSITDLYTFTEFCESHKKTLFYLEQLILKHNAHKSANNIKPVHEGLDFYYSTPQEAKKLVEFLQAVVPCRVTNSKEQVSHDPKSNVYNNKYSHAVEIVPICKDNIVCLPARVAHQLGNLSQICVVTRVTQVIQLIDPNTCSVSELRADGYWRNPFRTLCHPKQLSEFIVMEIEVIHDQKHLPGQHKESFKHQLADVWVVRSCDYGRTEDYLHCRTHLGHLLNPGDTVLGFDIQNANVNDDNFEKLLGGGRVPDVVLVKKSYSDSGRRAKKRVWRLKRLRDGQGTSDGGDSAADRDYNDFLEDLEEDPAIRQNINIYKGVEMPVEASLDDDEEFPRVSLAEMLDDLHISVDATGGEGAPMME